MEIYLSDDSVLGDAELQTAVELMYSLQVMTYALPKKTEEYMSFLLSKYLEKIGMADSYNKLNYCLLEILSNALKANVKRLYFLERNFDINNENDYFEGMKSFRNDFLEKRAYYFERLSQENIYTKFSLSATEDQLVIEIRNNSVMTEMEKLRVQKKMAELQNFSADAFMNDSIDDSEGAGFGIKSILLTLQALGLPEDHYQLFCEGEDTVARLVIENEPLIEL